MGEAQKILEEIYDTAHAEALEASHKGQRDVVVVCQTIGRIVDRVMAGLATQPDAVPELPPYVTRAFADNVFRIEFANGESEFIDVDCDPDDLDRIAEAARILAARERARRAGK